MDSISNLDKALNHFTKDYVAGTETILLIEDIIKLYEGYLASPTNFFPDPATKTYFLKEFTEELMKALKTSVILVDTEYKDNVKKLLNLLMDVALNELPTENCEFFHCIVPLFDPENAIYKSTLCDLHGRVIKYGSQIDPQWRAGLKEGDKLDLLKTESLSSGKLEGWMRGTIRRVDGSDLYCSFDGYPESDTYEFSRYESKISPLGSRTDNWDWREKLTKKDRVDAIDTQHKWYLGTVLDARTNSDETKELYIGYRFYVPDGSKIDSTNNERYEGWSSQYDTWINQYSVSIQPPNLIVKYGSIYCRGGYDQDSFFTGDADDVLQNYPMGDDKPCVIHRFNKSYSSTYIELINQFAARGGFKQIREIVPKLSNLEFLFVLFELIAGPINLYHRLFVSSELKMFLEAVQNYLQSVSGKELQWLKKERIDGALSTIKDIMSRVYTKKKKNELINEQKISFATCLLKSNKLERRIQAVRTIADICKPSELFFEGITHHKVNDNPALTRILKVSEFIKEVFGKHSHIQLVQRSTDILKFMFPNSKITEADFNIIWDCCEQDEQSKVEVFKIICETARHLPSELIGFIINKFAAVPMTSLKNLDVKVICELAKYYNNLDEKIMKEILEIIWKIINSEATGISVETIDKVMDCFCYVITTLRQVPEKLMSAYFSKCYLMIKERSNPILAYKILMTSMEQTQRVINSNNREETIDNYLNEGNVIDNFFIDVEAATAKAKAEIANDSFNPKAYKEETLVRKKFILFWLRCSNYKLNKKNLEVLWKNWVKEGIGEDQMIFYSFLKEITSRRPNENFSSLDDLKDFFIEFICSEDNDFQNLPAEGMEAIKIILIMVNKMMDKLVEIEYLKKPSSGFMQGFHDLKEKFQGNKEKDIEFRVSTPPTEIIGLSALWKIILEAKGEFVTLKAIELINKLHIKLSDELKNQITDISSKFIETAMEKLRLCQQRMVNSDRSGEIVKVLKLIGEMIEESEKKGNDAITPLIASGKGQPITVKLKNSYNDSMTFNGIMKRISENFSFVPRAEVNVHSKTTFWQLKMVIAAQLKVPVETIQVALPGREVTEKDHGKILEELKFVDNDIVTITKRSEEVITKASLLEGNKLSKKAVAVFTEIFEHFGQNEKITRDEYTTFTMACLNTSMILPNDPRIEEVFRTFNAEERGYLTLKEFLTFYEESSKFKEDTVRNNLRTLGYGADLNRIDQERNTDNSKKVTRKRLPRYLLPNNEDYMTLLFSLIKLGKEITNQVMHLMFKLCVSDKALKELKNIIVDKEFNWDSVMSASDIYKSTYYVHILLSLIGDGSGKELAELRNEPSEEVRKELRLGIINHKGIQYAIKSLKELKVDRNTVPYITMVVNLIMIHVFGSLTANKKLPGNVRQLIRITKEKTKEKISTCFLSSP